VLKINKLKTITNDDIKATANILITRNQHHATTKKHRHLAINSTVRTVGDRLRRPVAPPGCAARLRRPVARSGISASTKLLGYALVAPIVIIMTVLIAFPLVSAVTTSLHNQHVIGSPADFVGVDTYAKLLQDDIGLDGVETQHLRPRDKAEPTHVLRERGESGRTSHF